MNLNIFSLLKKLWSHFSLRRKRQYYFLLIFMIIVSFSEILSIGAVIPFLAVLADPTVIYNQEYISLFKTVFNINQPKDLVLPFAITFMVAVLISSLAKIVLLRFSTNLSYISGLEIGSTIFKKTLYQSYQVHIESNSSEVINGIVRKTDFIIKDIIHETTRLISAAFFFIIVLGFLIFINPQMAISIFIGFGFLYSLIIYLNKSRLSSNSKRISLNTNAVMKNLQESLGGIKQVILDGTQETFYKNFTVQDLNLKKAQANTFVLVSLPRFFIEGFGMIIISVVALYFSSRNDGITEVIPFLGALALGAQRLLPILNQAYQGISLILGGEESLRDILNFLDRPYQLLETDKSCELSLEKKISFEQVSFKYKKNSENILSNLSFVIEKDSFVGFVGETGSGKTTVLDLILGILSPTKGDFLVDETKIDINNLSGWQNNLSHVPQDIFISDASIKENIAFGHNINDIDFNLVKKVAKEALIFDFINDLPNKFETKIGERGVQLSGGQLQRIGIARALYKKPSVLILDEATSALDGITENKIVKNVQNISNITVIMVAHRLSTIKNCDKIFFLENGNISSEGKFEEVFEENDDFKSMVSAISKI